MAASTLFIRCLRSLSACLLALIVGGCIGLIPSPFRPSPGPREAPRLKDLAEAFDIVCRNFRLGPDDSIKVIFQQEWSIPEGTYRLDNLDKIGIKFLVDPSLNEDVVIRPDGMITLQAIGDMKAAGYTPQELASQIEKRFLQADILTSGEQTLPKGYRLVTVHVLEFYQKLAKLVTALTTIAGGQQSGATVNPDGTIDLPLLKDRVIAAGKTVRELEEEINRAYQAKILKHAVVSVALGEAKSRKFYVLGQGNAGAYDIRQPVTILHALAQSGGVNEDAADLTSVILISKDINGHPIGRRIDVKRMLDMGDLSSAILVKPYDVIYVPRTYIKDVQLFIEQYLGVVLRVKEFAGALATPIQGQQ